MKKILSVLFLIVFSFIFVLPIDAKMSDENISIERKSKHLGSRLHKEYGGYIYTINNISSQDINIDAISFEDNITSKVAYDTMKRSSLAEGAKTIGTGLVFAIPTLTLSLIGAVIIAPIKMVANTCGNIGAKTDSKRYDKKFEGNTIPVNNGIEIRTLAQKHNAPKITIIYHLQNDSEIRTISY